MKKKTLFWVTALLITFLGASGLVWGAEEVIKVGAINDMTGATSDVGKDYA
ncbi:MAG: branched-chain amino acid ABC transporter substrate-binding protein, partial [Desulfobacca sp.]|nr:branched-chain amino acid ABC transporter substrate-binding protein [Desulfobacca sp.]